MKVRLGGDERSTLDLVRARARDTPASELLHAADRSWTCLEFLHQSLRAAAGLRRAADENGRIAACMDSSAAMPFIVVGSMFAGVDLVLLPASSGAASLRGLLDQVSCGSVLTDRPELEEEAGVWPVADILRAADPFEAGGSPMGVFSFLTSGTEGTPKLVRLDHWKFWSAIAAMQRSGALDHAEGTTVFLTQPLFHSYGLCAFLEYLHSGATIVLPDPAGPLGPLTTLIRSPHAAKIEAIEGVPFFWQQFARTIDKMRLPKLSHVGIGGGRAEPADLAAVVARHPDITVSLRYGLTETPSVAAHKVYRPPHSGDWTSSGRPVPCYSLEIRNPVGEVAPTGEEGEIFVLGPLVHGDTGVLATGDLGRLDTRGELIVTGRKSAFLKRRGYRFGPEVIESAALRIEAVTDCRASNEGDGVLLQVVVQPGSSIRDLGSHLRATLPAYAVPDRIQEVESIARTPSGKIKRGHG